MTCPRAHGQKAELGLLRDVTSSLSLSHCLLEEGAGVAGPSCCWGLALNMLRSRWSTLGQGPSGVCCLWSQGS